MIWEAVVVREGIGLLMPHFPEGNNLLFLKKPSQRWVSWWFGFVSCLFVLSCVCILFCVCKQQKQTQTSWSKEGESMTGTQGRLVETMGRNRNRLQEAPGKLSGALSLLLSAWLHALWLSLSFLLCATGWASSALLPLPEYVKLKSCSQKRPSWASWCQSKFLGKVASVAQDPPLVQCLWPRGKRETQGTNSPISPPGSVPCGGEWGVGKWENLQWRGMVRSWTNVPPGLHHVDSHHSVIKDLMSSYYKRTDRQALRTTPALLEAGNQNRHVGKLSGNR